jgi:hypothetical protein
VLPHNRGWSDGVTAAEQRADSEGVMPTYTCLCCGHTQTFDTAEETFEASWDVAPYFTLQPLCDFCPSAPVLIYGLDGARSLHADEHADWKKHGRPTPLRELTGEEPNQDQN